MKPAAVVGLGEVMLRLTADAGRTLENTDVLNVHAAGAEGNTLAALARLGVPSALVTVFPDTPIGHRAAGELATAGVSLDNVQWIPGGRMGTFFVEQGVGARAAGVIYDRAGSAFAEYVRWPQGALSEAKCALVSGITPALSASARQAAAEMVEEAERFNVPLCVDVNYRSRLWSTQEARDGLAPLLARSRIVVCAGRDAESVFDSDPDDPAAFRARWAPQAEVCVITAGELGARAVGEDDQVRSVDAVPTVVVDRLGLGDAFLAGLIDGLLRGLPLEDALHTAASLAALKATVHGDLSLARRHDLNALINTGAEWPQTGIVR